MNTHTVNEAAAAVLSAGLRAALEADALGRECVRVWCVRVRVCAVEQDPAGSPPSTLFTELCSWFVLTLRASVCGVLWARKMNSFQMAFSFL